MTPQEIIRLLKLKPHPEGGYYRETFRDKTAKGRAFSTAIYFLLRRGEVSRWHRVDAAEIWHWHAGAPLALLTRNARGRIRREILGSRLDRGQRPQGIVPAQTWQSAQSLGAWTLVGCTVAPGFEFAGFELEASRPFGRLRKDYAAPARSRAKKRAPRSRAKD